MNARQSEAVGANFIQASLRQDVIHKEIMANTVATPKLKQSAVVGDWSTLVIEDPWSCVRGFSFGLQFNKANKGACYNAVNDLINAEQDLTTLLSQFYLPTVWANILLTGQNQLTYFTLV